MKKTLLFAALAAILSTGCNMQSYDIPTKSGEPIRFTTSGLKASVETKASEVTSSTLATSGFYVSATTGTTLQDETDAFSDVLFTKSGDFWTGGKLWPAEDPGYHFFASNVEMSNTQTIAASAATDVVVAYLPDPVFREENTLAFKHIFARLHNVTIEVPSGYTVSDVDVRLTPYTSGTFDIRSGYGQTDGTGWSSLVTGEDISIASADGSVKENNIYLVPGNYRLATSWTIRKDDFVCSYENIGYDVTLVGGKENNVSMTLYGNTANEMAVSFRLSVEAWGSEDVVAEREAPVVHELEVAGDFTVNNAGDKVRFANGNLQAIIDGSINEYSYTASIWKFADHQWDYIGYKDGTPNTYSNGETVDLFSWVGTSALYNNYGLYSISPLPSNTNINTYYSYYGNSTADGLKTDWGSIPGVISACGEGWRTLTKDEWSYIFYSRESGAVVNEVINARYTLAEINIDKSNTVEGVILFPDGVVITSEDATSWDRINATITDSNWGTKCTSAQWKALEEKGCVFLPAANARQLVPAYGNAGYYWSSTSSTSTAIYAYYVEFHYNHVFPREAHDRSFCCSVRLVRDSNL